MEQFMENFYQLKFHMTTVLNQQQKQLYVSMLVFLPTLFIFLLLHKLRQRRSHTVVLAGLSGSGKTTTFYQLRDGSSHLGTVTSMEHNEGTFVFHSELNFPKKQKIRPVHVVDAPGHPRLRLKLDEFLPRSAAIVFVVDAVDFLPNCRANAEFLYDVLTKGAVVKRKVPVLIVCNKSDKLTAHSKEFIWKQLEKEIDKLKASRVTVSEADVRNEFDLGTPGERFSFSQCQNKIALADASALTGDVSQIEDFIRLHVRR